MILSDFLIDESVDVGRQFKKIQLPDTTVDKILGASQRFRVISAST